VQTATPRPSQQQAQSILPRRSWYVALKLYHRPASKESWAAHETSWDRLSSVRDREQRMVLVSKCTERQETTRNRKGHCHLSNARLSSTSDGAEAKLAKQLHSGAYGNLLHLHPSRRCGRVPSSHCCHHEPIVLTRHVMSCCCCCICRSLLRNFRELIYLAYNI
jgi:hypothetical protein